MEWQVASNLQHHYEALREWHIRASVLRRSSEQMINDTRVMIDDARRVILELDALFKP